jgi:acyl-coenzyme A synthetase/AMP-(fatty) acid ligase
MPDGLLVITGRVNEVINRGGDKLAPEVIEGALRLIPEISDAAVFAVPNTDQIWAAVVAKQPLQHEAILAFCRQKLAGMAPDRIFELERIPRNDMGKIIREEMREAIMKRLSSSFM